MANDTKNRILESALDIFARDGYSGANIKDIAEATGVVKSAFYRHYESKDAIFNALVEAVSEHYEKRFSEIVNQSNMPQSCEKLKEMSLRMVNFTIYDERIVKMRKIFMQEQFRNNEIGDLATKYFLENTEKLFTDVFEVLMANGQFKKGDAGLLALEFASPITVLINYHDRQVGKDKEIMARINDHIDHFIATHKQK